MILSALILCLFTLDAFAHCASRAESAMNWGGITCVVSGYNFIGKQHKDSHPIPLSSGGSSCTTRVSMDENELRNGYVTKSTAVIDFLKVMKTRPDCVAFHDEIRTYENSMLRQQAQTNTRLNDRLSMWETKKHEQNIQRWFGVLNAFHNGCVAEDYRFEILVDNNGIDEILVELAAKNPNWPESCLAEATQLTELMKVKVEHVKKLMDAEANQLQCNVHLESSILQKLVGGNFISVAKEGEVITCDATNEMCVLKDSLPKGEAEEVLTPVEYAFTKVERTPSQEMGRDIQETGLRLGKGVLRICPERPDDRGSVLQVMSWAYCATGRDKLGLDY